MLVSSGIAKQEGLNLTWVSLKSERTNSQEIQGNTTLPPHRFHTEVATSHQDVTILQQVWHPPWFPSDTSLWQDYVVLQTKSGIYPAGHKLRSFSNGFQERWRPLLQSQGWIRGGGGGLLVSQLTDHHHLYVLADTVSIIVSSHLCASCRNIEHFPKKKIYIMFTNQESL